MKSTLEIYDEMNLGDLVKTNSRYLTKDDAGESGMIVTIKYFDREVLMGDDDDVEKTIMFFEEESVKPMVLNKTNANLLPIITGCKTVAEVIGKKIIVYCDPTISFGSRITGGLRIKSASIAKPREPEAKEFDEKVPF